MQQQTDLQLASCRTGVRFRFVSSISWISVIILSQTVEVPPKGRDTIAQAQSGTGAFLKELSQATRPLELCKSRNRKTGE